MSHSAETQSPNHALQRTRSAVTLAASCRRLSHTTQPARQLRESLSLGSFGESTPMNLLLRTSFLWVTLLLTIPAIGFAQVTDSRAALGRIKLDRIDCDRLSPELALIALADQVNRAGVKLNVVVARRLVSRGEPVTTDTVTLHMRNVTPIEVLAAITKPIWWTYSVQENGTVVVWDGTRCPADVLVTRAFTLPKNFLASAGDDEQVDVQKQLADYGVESPPGSSAIYRPSKQLLIIRNSLDSLDLVQAILDNAKKRRP